MSLFICYAIFDIPTKVMAQKKYDMEKILLTVQKDYPGSKLKFQNICVVDNYMKRRTGRNSSDYYESECYFIRNGKLHKEPNYLFLLGIIPVFIAFSIFCGDPRKIKVRDLQTATKTIGLLLLSVVIITVLSFVFAPETPYFMHKASPSQFKNSSKGVINNIDLNNYLKKSNK